MDINNRLTRAFLIEHAADAARTVEKLSPEIGAELLAALEPEIAARVLSHMIPSSAGDCLTCVPRRQALAILGRIRKVNAARILQSMDRADAHGLMQGMSISDRLSLRYLLKYQHDTVGSVMDTNSFFLPDGLTVAEAVKRVRRHRRAVGCEIFVVDRARRLAGVVQTDALLKAAHHGPLGPLVRTRTPFLRTRVRIAVARSHVGWRNQRRLPVVESDGTLVGTIEYRTVLEEFASTEATPAPVDALGGMLDFVQLYWIAMANLLSMFTRRVDEQSILPEGGA